MAENLNPVLGNMAKDPKATEDFTKETEEIMAKAETMAKAGRLEEATDEILLLEKKTRMSADGISTAKLLCCIVQLHYDTKEWSKLREYIVLLSKKRGQLKRAITDMVHLAMKWLPDLEQDKKLELIATLNEVTEGKIFLEVEKARLTKQMAEMKEAEGKIEEAAGLLQEVQVETFGAMDRREKTEYIVNQMRLVLTKKDYVRTQIISKKLNPKLLEAEDFQDLKVQYYEFMVAYWIHEEKYLEVAKAYFAIFSTPEVQADAAKWQKALTAHILYLCLAMFDNEQNDMMHKLEDTQAKKLDKIPAFQQLIKVFLRQELAPWPLAQDTSTHDVFKDTPHAGGSARWTTLRKRVVQHNLKVMATYYDEIHTKRVAELLNLEEKEVEAELSELVCSKFVYAKIDRPAGFIRFGQKQTYRDTLNDWSGNLSKMLDLVETTCHLIQKEQMVHAARAKIKAKK
mmetsp:Transcript_27487/g.63558  ORF Transcript_27487/g.63558 Transcript_27487/m.63558 type:complete len:457 (-) Transcript_27487:81-1451(-)